MKLSLAHSSEDKVDVWKIGFAFVTIIVLVVFIVHVMHRQNESRSPLHIEPEKCPVDMCEPQTKSVPEDERIRTFNVSAWVETIRMDEDFLLVERSDVAAERNSAANELFSLPELPDGVVGDLARMFASTDEDEVWRDYCLQFLGSALEREDGVTDEDRALARETLVEALASTNATFAGTALRALHRGAPADPLVPSSALRIARDPSYPSASRTTALLILEECSSLGADGEAVTPEERRSVLRETAASLSADPSASSLLRRTAEAVQKRSSVQSHDQWNDRGGSQ